MWGNGITVHTYTHKGLAHLISCSHNILYECYREHSCLRTFVDAIQPVTVLIVSKHRHGIAQEVYTTTAGFKLCDLNSIFFY